MGTQGAGPAVDRPATDTTVPKWSDDDLLTMWQVGRDYERARLALLGVEFTETELVDARRTHEVHIAERLAEMARCAEAFHAKHGTKPHIGGEVAPW